MKIDRKYLYGLLSDALSIEILGYIDIGYGPSGSLDYEASVQQNTTEGFLSRKFIEVVQQFIKDNDINLIEQHPCESCVPEDFNVHVIIDDVPYVITEDQLDEYHSLQQNTNAIKAAKFLSEIFALPLSTTYEFAKNNRYLKTVY